MRLIINDNGNSQFKLYDEHSLKYRGHIHIYDLEASAINLDEELLENVWSQAVICLSSRKGMPGQELSLNDQANTQIGLHIIKERSNMDDIRFTDPLLQKEEHRPVDMTDSHNHHMQQQQTNLASLELHVGQGRDFLLRLPPSALSDNLNWDSNSKLISSSTTNTIQGKYSQGWPHFSWLVH